MPRVKLPNTAKGWVIVLGSSFVGFVAGTAALDYLSRILK